MYSFTWAPLSWTCPKIVILVCQTMLIWGLLVENTSEYAASALLILVCSWAIDVFVSPKLCSLLNLLMFVVFQVTLISSRTCLPIIKPMNCIRSRFWCFYHVFWNWDEVCFASRQSHYVVNWNTSLETKLCLYGIFGSAVLNQIFLYSSLYAYRKIWILISFSWKVFFSIFFKKWTEFCKNFYRRGRLHSNEALD